ncbi:hypothetical protein MRX96_005373 [Rhipicephalus microplus]
MRSQSEVDTAKPAGEDEKVLEPLREKCQSLDFHPFQNGHTNPHGGNIGRRYSSRMSVRSALGDNDSACAVSVSGLCMVVSDGEMWHSREEHLDRRCSPAPSLRKLNEASPLAPLWEAGSVPDTAQNTEKQSIVSTTTDDDAARSSLCANITRVVLKDLRLLGNKYFILVTTSAVGFFFVFSTFIIIIPDYAADKGLPISDGVFLLSVYGIADLFSKPIPGPFGIQENNGQQSYWFFVVMTLLFGLVTGGLIFMTPVLLTEFLGAKLAVMAFGMCNLFIGITCLLRPFIIGYFKDNWHSYNGLFYTMAVACILSSLSWYVPPAVNKVWTCVSRPKESVQPQEV